MFLAIHNFVCLRCQDRNRWARCFFKDFLLGKTTPVLSLAFSCWRSCFAQGTAVGFLLTSPLSFSQGQIHLGGRGKFISEDASLQVHFLNEPMKKEISKADDSPRLHVDVTTLSIRLVPFWRVLILDWFSQWFSTLNNNSLIPFLKILRAKRLLALKSDSQSLSLWPLSFFVLW